MLVLEPGRLTGRLAIEKAVRAECIELHHPVANNLHTHSANPGCFRPRRTVVDRGQSQKSPRLITQWKRQAIENLAKAFDDKASDVQVGREAEVAKLYAKISQLVVE